MPARPTYASFLVRLWREAEPDPREMAADWQGEVQYIQTSQRWTFRTLDELLSFLRQVTDEEDASGWMLGHPAQGSIQHACSIKERMPGK